MTRKTWRFWAAGLVALLALAGVVTGANAAFPAAPSAAAPAAAAPAAGQPASKPEVVDCSLIATKHIDMQMNAHAASILAACGKAGPARPQDQASIGGSAVGKVRPNNYGGVDQDVILSRRHLAAHHPE